MSVQNFSRAVRRRGIFAGFLALAILLSASAQAAPIVLYQNYDPDDAFFSPSYGLNIWFECPGRAVPFTVDAPGYVTEIEVPLHAWGIADRGNLVVELMPDLGAAIPGFIYIPDDSAVIEKVVHTVDDWAAGPVFRDFKIQLSGSTLLEPGVVYWLALSLDQIVPPGVPGLTWWTVTETGSLAAQSGTHPNEYWYPSRFGNLNAVKITGVSAVPLPATAWLLLTGLGALFARRMAMVR